MRLVVVLGLVVASAGCLPNPQSEWVNQDGSVQRSTLEDPTILAARTGPAFDFAWLPDPIALHFGGSGGHVARRAHVARR